MDPKQTPLFTAQPTASQALENSAHFATIKKIKRLPDDIAIECTSSYPALLGATPEPILKRTNGLIGLGKELLESTIDAEKIPRLRCGG